MTLGIEKKFTFPLLLACLLLLACKKQAETGLSAPELAPGEVALLRPKIPLWRSFSNARFVIRNLRDWESAWRRTQASKRSDGFTDDSGPKTLPAGLNLEENIVLIVLSTSNAGEQSLEIVSAKEKGSTVLLEVIENTCLPPPDTGSVTAIYSVGDAVAIKKTDKQIVFNVVETNQCPHPKLKQNMIRPN